MDRLSRSDRLAIIFFFASGMLVFLAWAFPNMSQIITIPGAVLCFCAMLYFAWPEVRNLFAWLEGRKKTVPPLTPADISYNVALGAGIMAWIAAFFRGRKLAFVFALVATAAIAFDYWNQPREFIWFGTAYKGYPLAWSAYSVGTDFGNDFQILVLRFGGRNDSKKEVVLSDAHIISGLTGKEMHLEALVLGKIADIKDINAIPAKAVITLDADLDSKKGISVAEFKRTWGVFSLIVKVDGEVQRYDYDRVAVEQILKHEKFDFDAFPRVTLKNSKDAR
jgi:hypothetical protein